MKLETLLVEKGLNRLLTHINSHAIGILTAFRSYSINEHGEQIALTRQDNLKRNAVLSAKIRVKGYWYVKVSGTYIEGFGTDNPVEVSEDSFLVINPFEGDDGGELEDDLIRWGIEFDQDSILSKRYNEDGYLIGTSNRDDAYPGLHKKESVGQFHPGKTSVFFSKTRNRPFTFEGAVTYPPATINGIRGLRMLIEKGWKQ